MLTELAEELSSRHCKLKLWWISGDTNQLVDDLTNLKFVSFDEQFPVNVIGSQLLKWRVLDKLLRGAEEYYSELQSQNKTKLARFHKRTERKCNLDPW